MRIHLNIETRSELFKGHDLTGRSLGGATAPEGNYVPHVNTSVNSEKVEADTVKDEREVKLELWMEDVKAFIRNVDINNL